MATCHQEQGSVLATPAALDASSKASSAECFLLQTLYNALLENNCSEQASRMAAMESSTKNATEMISKLSLQYNRWGSQQMWQSRKHLQCCYCILGSSTNVLALPCRTRQATITTELIEIISGAAALEAGK